MRFHKKMLRIPCTEHISNGEVLDKMKPKMTHKRQVKFLGYEESRLRTFNVHRILSYRGSHDNLHILKETVANYFHPCLEMKWHFKVNGCIGGIMAINAENGIGESNSNSFHFFL